LNPPMHVDNRLADRHQKSKANVWMGIEQRLFPVCRDYSIGSFGLGPDRRRKVKGRTG